MRAVAALPACALIAGAALALSLDDPHTTIAYAWLAAASCVVVSAWWIRWTRTFIVAMAALFGAGAYLLGVDGWQRAWRPPLRVAFDRIADEHEEAFMVLEGTLRADATRTATGVSLSLDVDTFPSCPSCPSALSSGVLLTVVGALAADRMDVWRAGRRVRLPATLRRPSRYLDPGVPDQERALARRGTTLVGTVKSGALVEVLSRGSRMDEALAEVRAFSRRAIGEAVGRWSPRAAAIVAAIVIGDRTGLDADVQRSLQDAGTYHVIAISGGNIAILAGLLLGAFRLAGWLGRPAMIAAIALLAAYAMLVGGGASVDRATLMAALYLAGRACDQRSPPLNTLALAAGLLVVVDPLSVADPAFILTFGATLAILVAVPRITAIHAEAAEPPEPAAQRCSAISAISALIVRAWRPARSMFAASLAAEAMLFPIGALVFSRITFAGLALNFAAIPLMAVAQIAGMAVVPLTLVSHAASTAAGWIAALGADGLVWSAGLVRFAPAVAYRVAAPSLVVVALYYAAMAAAVGAQGFRRACATGAAAAAALWILIDPHTLVARRGDGRLHVTFIDVGQGDAAFVRFPHGRTLLVDAGGLSFSSSFDIGDRVVAPVVRSAGFRRIDYVALTHGDPDHIGGARSVIREFRPREVWEGIPVPRFAPLTELRLAAQAQGARWANVYAGDRITLDDVDVIARHPEPADWERQKVRNDDSIVLELRWRDVSVLLTGDIGQAVERALAAQLPPSPLRVVKVAHHGSATSSSAEFVAAWHPQVAVVSVGRGNHFGHPVPDVVARYRSMGSQIFRTDQDGAVFVDTDGTSIAVRTFMGRSVGISR